MNELMPIELICSAPKNAPVAFQSHKTPKDDPCESCICRWVCSGAKIEGSVPDWSLAMACTAFKRFIQPTKAGREQTLNPNRMPSREIYVKVFG